MRSYEVVAAGLLLLAGSACVEQAPDGAAERESELVARTLLMASQNADTAAIVDLFWPQATYDDFPNQVTHQGIDEIVSYLTSAHTWGDDVYINVGEVHVSPTGAVAEWIFSAVQNRPLGTSVPEPSGLEVVMNGVTIIELDGDRIIRAADYTDSTPMWLQLGARIELPGGGTVELSDYGR